MVPKAFPSCKHVSLYFQKSEVVAPVTGQLSAAKVENWKMELLHSTKVALVFQVFNRMLSVFF